MSYAVISLEHHWMPFTANRSFKAAPRLLVRAEGMYYWDQHGNKIMDEVDYVPHFSFGHPSSYKLARRIAGIAPDGISHCSSATPVPKRSTRRLSRHSPDQSRLRL